jgi:hypothetical protein
MKKAVIADQVAYMPSIAEITLKITSVAGTGGLPFLHLAD